MRAQDAARLLLLAAVWGGAFVFVRVAVPHFGAIGTALGRVLLGGLCLTLWLRATGTPLELRRHGRFYFTIGLLTSALPFSLHAWAAHFIPASFSVLLNATSPFFGAFFAWLLLDERFAPRALAGMALAFVGVAVLVGSERLVPGVEQAWAVAAALAACACYGVAGAWTRMRGAGTRPMGVAAGSQLGASLLLVVLLPLAPPFVAPLEPPTPAAVLCVAGAGILGSALAYALYFRLIADIGPAQALTVTFLMPVFGMGFGWLFLDEVIDARMLSGAALVVAGTALALLSPSRVATRG